MTWGPAPLRLGGIARDLLNDPNDPRVGSSRDNATGGTASHITSGGSSGSLTSLGITLAPILIYTAVCLLVFFGLRTRCAKVFSPRTIPGLQTAGIVSPTLPSGWFNWIKPFFLIPDAVVLSQSSLDGFFFLRYVKLLGTISFAGCLCVWPILLPVHGTGANGLAQLDLLTIGNVSNPHSFYAHVAVAYCFFGFVLFTICRESIYWINLRQAFLLSPVYSQRLSSRTVLFTCVPNGFLDQAKIRKLFGDSVKNTWIPRNTAGLRRLVEEREQTAIRLEKAEIDLIKMANAARTKAIGKHMRTFPPFRADPFGFLSSRQEKDAGARVRKQSLCQEKGCDQLPTVEVFNPDPLTPPASQYDPGDQTTGEDLYLHPYGLDPSLPDVRGSVAAQWIPAESRPSHRPLANFGRKVDTIRWTRLRLKSLNTQIAALRRQHRRGNGSLLSSVFVEFDSQASAQAAYQILAHHLPLHMAPRFVGVKPNDVIWSSLRMKWWERIMRSFLILGVVALAIIFWSIPAALVGIASNIQFLSEHIPFLSWIELLPSVITGFIQGLLPALALSWLMAIVPWMLRGCARAAGVPTVTGVELFTQNAYFIFQVVQVFLITTLTSAASAALSQILEDPLSVKDLLSQNIPKASNFYLSYILVQCLGRSAWALAHIPKLLSHEFIGKRLQNPRSRFKSWRKLKKVHWGAVYPVFTNMGVIAMSYACIAPLVLLFSGLGMCCVYVAYRYNLLYTLDPEPDTEGLVYPTALTQLIAGLYLAQICLIGLFALKTAIPQLILMVLFFVFTIVVNISLSDALHPLLHGLPRTLVIGEDGDIPEEVDAAKMSEDNVYYDSDSEPVLGDEEELPMDTYANRGMEGASGLAVSLGNLTKSFLKARVKKESEDSGLTQILESIRAWLTPDRNTKPNFFTRWLHPEVFDDFQALRGMIISPHLDGRACGENDPEKYRQNAYWPPEMWEPAPKLWVPRDEARVSRQEVAHTRDLVRIFDDGAWLDEYGRIQVDLSKAPFERPLVAYRAA